MSVKKLVDESLSSFAASEHEEFHRAAEFSAFATVPELRWD